MSKKTEFDLKKVEELASNGLNQSQIARYFGVKPETISQHKKYEDFVLYVEYDGIVDACEYYLENHMLLKQIALKGYNKFAEYPETEFLARALAHSHKNVL